MHQGSNYTPPPNIPNLPINMNPILPNSNQGKPTMHVPIAPGFNQIPQGFPQAPGLNQFPVPQGTPPVVPILPKGMPNGLPGGFPQNTPVVLPPGAQPGLPPNLPQGLPQNVPLGLPPGAPQASNPNFPGFPQLPAGLPQSTPPNPQAKTSLPQAGFLPGNQGVPIPPNGSSFNNYPSLPNVPQLPNFNNVPNPPQLQNVNIVPNPPQLPNFNNVSNVPNIPNVPILPNAPGGPKLPGPNLPNPNLPGPNLPGQMGPGLMNMPPAPNMPFNVSQIPPPPSQQYIPNNFSPQYSSNVSNSSISLQSSQASINNAFNKSVNCNPKTATVINSHNLHRDISRKYGGNIIHQGNKFLVEGPNQSIVDQMCDELNNLIKQYTFDDNAHWAYLENDGSYRMYDKVNEELIEAYYRNVYPELTSAEYKNYSLSVDLNMGGGSYILEFARIGGVHRQKRKNVGSADDTIRAVKRQGTGEDLNKNFVRNYRWEWKHESGQFRPYEDDAIFLIEQSYIEFTSKKTKSAIVLIQGCNGKTYKLDFSTNTQFNEITNFKRTIQRIQL